MSKKSLILYSVLFYSLFVAIRLFGLFSFDVQPDEVHWVDRSHKVLLLFNEGKYSELTTHLGQPGIVPSLFMALGQGIGEEINCKFNIKPGDLLYLHPLFLCRLACVFVSSLIVFPLLLIGTALFDFRIVALTCFLLALSPHHIGLSRLAHLDAVMTVTVVTSFLFYMRAVQSGNEKYKLLAGIFWGLSIATKPTALSLVIGFLLIGVISSVFVKKRGLKEVISVYDLWAILIGHIVFTALYTRIWVHESDYLVRLRIESRFADYIYFLGETYHFIGLLLSLAIFGFSYYRFKTTNNKGYSYGIFLACLIFFVFQFPIEVEGLIRFWGWVFGLSSTPHKAYGRVWEPEKGGYFFLILFEIPLVILSLAIFSLMRLGNSLLKGRFLSSERKQTYFFVIFVVWVAILSTSSKQTLRYIVPVLPCLYLLAADSIWRIFDFSSLRIHWLKNKGMVFCLLFLVPQSYAVISTHPNQVAFYNILGGGIDGVVERGGMHYLIGVNKLVVFLREQMLSSKRGKSTVYVGGELAVPKVAHNILYPGADEVKFAAPVPIMWGSYFLRYHHLDSLFFDPVPNGIDVDHPDYEVKLGKKAIATLYRVRAPDLSTPYFIKPTKLHRKVGQVKLVNDSIYASKFPKPELATEAIELIKGRERKGFSFFASDIELPEGSYELLFYAKLAHEQTAKIPAFEIQFGECKQVVYSDEMDASQFKPFISKCSIEKTKYLSFKLYWFGKSDLVVGSGSLQRMGDVVK